MLVFAVHKDKEVRDAPLRWPTVRGNVQSSRAFVDDDFAWGITVRFVYEVGGVRYAGAQTWYVGSGLEEPA